MDLKTREAGSYSGLWSIVAIITASALPSSICKVRKCVNASALPGISAYDVLILNVLLRMHTELGSNSLIQ